MMLRPVVALPSATLSATSLRPGYLAASSSLKPLLRASSEPTPGRMRDERDVALGLAVFRGDRLGHAVGGDAAALHVVGGQERGEGLRIGGGVDADDRHLLGGFVDRLAERLELGRRDDDRGRLFGDGVLEDRNLAVDVGLGLGAELGNVDAEILAGLAGAGQHDLPIERRRVLDDDRDGRLVGGVTRRAQGGERDQRGGDKKFLHASSSFGESRRGSRLRSQLRTPGSCFVDDAASSAMEFDMAAFAKRAPL